MAHEVFISHSSKDKVVADAVTASLEQAGIRCWIAPRDIRAGDSWGGAIVSAIESSKVMVVIFSSRSNDSKQVMREVERAVQHDVVVVPYRIEDVKPSKDMEYFLSATHWLDAMSPSMDKSLATLVETTSSILDRSEQDAEKRTKPTMASATPSQASPVTPEIKSDSYKQPFFKSLIEKFKTQLIMMALAVIACLAGYIWLTSGGEKVNSEGKVERVTADNLGERDSDDIKLKVTDEAVAGTTIITTWKGQAASNDYIVVAKKDSNDNAKPNRAKVGSEQLLELRLPSEPGDYQLRFYDGKTGKVLARSNLEIDVPHITIDAPKSAMAGSKISVAWKALNLKGDYLSIAKLGANKNSCQSYAYTKAGSPTEIRMPDQSGKYELRYHSGNGKTVWHSQEIKVTQPEVKIPSLDEQIAGSFAKIDITGPRNKSDYVSVAEIGSDPNQYLQFSYLNENPTVKLKMPEIPGSYEVRYISGQKKLIWAKQKVTIKQPAVAVKAPIEALVGSYMPVEWQGPANRSDRLTVSEIGSEGNEYVSLNYVGNSKKTNLVMPNTPGDYEVRYISGTKNLIWASQKIKVLPWNVNLSAPEVVKSGKRFKLSWSAKGGKSQYVGIYKPGVEKAITYQYTNKRDMITFTAPKEEGEYQLRYYSSGSDPQLWAEKKLIVE